MPKIDIDRMISQTGLSVNLQSVAVEEMKADIGKICKILSFPSKSFNSKEAFSVVKDYVQKHDRLLYAEISSHCYNLSSKEIANFQGNLDSLIEYVYSWDFDNGIKAEEGSGNNKEVELRKMTKRIVIKLYDNVNLACTQMTSLRRSEEDLHSTFVKEFEPAKAEITKEVNSQLITLVGIFTAIAFLVFGGFSSLTDVFMHIGDNLSKTIMLLSVWGLVICNGVFIFLGCVEKIVQRGPITVFFSKNNIFSWTNLILLFVFFGSLWSFIVDKYNWGTVIIRICENAVTYISIAGFVVIILLFVLGIYVINRKSKK